MKVSSEVLFFDFFSFFARKKTTSWFVGLTETRARFALAHNVREVDKNPSLYDIHA